MINLQKTKKINSFIFLFIILVLVITIGLSTTRNQPSQISGMVGSVFSPVQKVFYSIGQTFTNSFDLLLNISRIREENLQLQEKNSMLQEENIQLKYIVNNSEALKNEYEMLSNIQYDYVKSQIVSRDIGNWFERFTIDKGTNNGIQVDDIVIKAVKTEDQLVKVGLIGKVVDVGYNWSKVVTIDDIISSVSIKVLRTNEGGVAKGSINGIIEAFMFSQTEDLKVDDEIVTSGLGEIYLPNIYIGKVAKIEKTSDLLTEKITIIPIVDFERLYEVFVIKVDRR
ncbi:MAG: Cell shape-determining protein MreC [Clostridiales bacterium 38_11]|nr:MAG: Cell shape-determining protein MreC [Clostridiales bacterium 38_11]